MRHTQASIGPRTRCCCCSPFFVVVKNLLSDILCCSHSGASRQATPVRDRVRLSAAMPLEQLNSEKPVTARQ